MGILDVFKTPIFYKNYKIIQTFKLEHYVDDYQCTSSSFTLKKGLSLKLAFNEKNGRFLFLEYNGEKYYKGDLILEIEDITKNLQSI